MNTSRLAIAVDELRDNPEQWDAFRYSGNCVVLAPPGSGKTKLLTTKAVWLANNEVERGRGVACITLTNPAAAELRSRIRHLGQRVGRAVVVGTVHSFAWSHIIRPFAAPAGYPEWNEYTLAPRDVQRRAMSDAISSVYGPHDDVRLVESTVRRNRKLCLLDTEWARTGPEIHRVSLEYEHRLRTNSHVDFDDVVAMAVRLVEAHAFVGSVLNARFPYLLVDEYQDLAPGLHRIVTAVSLETGSTRLFAVGDPDQAIYGWTGTRPELLVDLARRTDVHRVLLRINYRCSARIASASRLILDADESETVAVREGGSVNVHCEPDGMDAQADYICGRIVELAANGVPLQQIAVLAPTNADCDELVAVLRERDVPVAWRSDAYGQSPLTMLFESCAAWAACGREDTGYQLGDLLDQWRQLGDSTARHVHDYKLVALLMNAESGVNASSFIEELAEVMRVLGVLDQLRSDDVNELERMRSAFGPGGSMAGYTVFDLGRLGLRDGRVEVSTMSSSKGLEFDYVFIAALEQGKMPFYSSVRGSAAWEEDRRKFYVSFTRARDVVEVVYSGWYRTSWGSLKRNGPSAFLREAGLVS